LDLNKVLVATRNQGKIREISSILEDINIEIRSLKDFPDIPEIEEDGLSFSENALKKARYVSELTGEVTIADDSGLEVEYLSGKPGVHSARYAGEHATDALNIEKLLKELKNVPYDQRKAKFRCVIILCSPKGPCHSVEGECKGIIGFEPRGTHGFGYDPVFIVPGYNRTMAEIEPEVKNRISHRARALEKLKKILVESV
jgi:XTP/dITP diphosphohydrolase